MQAGLPFATAATMFVIAALSACSGHDDGGPVENMSATVTQVTYQSLD